MDSFYFRNDMTLYTISALGADKTIFDAVDFNGTCHHLDWITPLEKETITSYAKRLTQKINTNEDFVLVGVSFGGLIATEIAKILQPQKTILISSAANRKELNVTFRLMGKIKILAYLPLFFFQPPKRIVKYFFSTERTDVLYPILDKTNKKFAKWSILQLLNWQNNVVPKSVVKINGNIDRLISPSGESKTHIVQNGGHFMVVDKAEKVSKIVNEILANL